MNSYPTSSGEARYLRPVTIPEEDEKKLDYIGEGGQIDMRALLRRADETGREIWTDDNVGEVLPTVITPLTWSVLEPMANQAFRSFLSDLGIQVDRDYSLFGRFFGRVYFNQSEFQRLMRRFYPSQARPAGVKHWRLLERISTALALSRIGLRTLVGIPLLLVRTGRALQAIPGQLEKAIYPSELNEQEVWEQIERWQQTGRKTLAIHLAVTIYASLLYSLLEKLVARWSKGSVPAAHLVTGLPGMMSAETGRDLEKLAGLAADIPELRDLLNNGSMDALADTIQRLDPENSFALSLDDFLLQHGHASLQEFELAFPRWREEPAFVLAAIQNYLQASVAGFEPSSSEKQEQVRIQAVEQVRHSLGIGPSRLFFEVLLSWAQRYSVARENMKFLFVMGHSHLRSLYLAAADQLIGRSLLKKREDLFYLTQEEILALYHGNWDVKQSEAAILARRDEMMRYGASQHPRVIEQLPDGTLQSARLPAGSSPAPRPTERHAKTTLTGVAASPGRVSGQARVIFDPTGPVLLKPGEILVTRSTNPAWAPLFLTAGALVTEIGGLLSHGAIVAREYGLPAVLNVKGATQAIHSGQHLLVDGFEGTVQFLDET